MSKNNTPEKQKKVDPRKIIFDEDQIKQIQRLAGYGCSVKDIGYIMGVSKSTMDRMIDGDEQVSEAIANGRAMAGSEVLATAFKMATSGSQPWMTGFWLKCRMGWKEPKEQVEREEVEFEMSYKK